MVGDRSKDGVGVVAAPALLCTRCSGNRAGAGQLDCCISLIRPAGASRGRCRGLVRKPHQRPLPFAGERFQAGHTLREDNPAIRLVFAGDPARGIPPCAACHGPGDHKLGAPQLKTQQPTYIERQLAAFAQGFRQNDINEQMRTIAAQLTPEEMHLVAEFYGTGAAAAQMAVR
jgi:cytochrome c553